LKKSKKQNNKNQKFKRIKKIWYQSLSIWKNDYFKEAN
jgi:hypothetical protein